MKFLIFALAKLSWATFAVHGTVSNQRTFNPPCPLPINISSTFGFTKNLYKEIAQDNPKKFAFSPLSIHVLFSMLLPNIDDDFAADELRNVLRLSNNNCTEFYNFSKKFENLEKISTIESENTIACKTRPLHTELVKLLNTTFHPKIFCPSHKSNMKENGIFTNNLNFTGKWKIPFINTINILNHDETLSATGSFLVGKLERVKADFFIFPFKDSDIKIIIIKPKMIKNLHKIERNLRLITYDELLKVSKEVYTTFIFHQLKINNTINLKPVLRCEMGLNKLFARTEKRGNKRVKVQQDAFIELDKDGARFSVTTKLAIGVEEKHFDSDPRDARGIFLIADKSDYLFMGHY